MVKFSKQMELQLVPEWRHKFCDYWKLKKEIKMMKMQRDGHSNVEINSYSQGDHNMLDHGEKWSVTNHDHVSWTPLSNFTRRNMNPWAHGEMIKVHVKMIELGGEITYETEVLEPWALDTLEKSFFHCMDEELNKVNKFFCSKEQEFVERAQILNRQLINLARITQTYQQPPTTKIVLHTSSIMKFHHKATSTLHSFFNACFQTFGSTTTNSNHHHQSPPSTESEENSRHPLCGDSSSQNLPENEEGSERPSFLGNHVIDMIRKDNAENICHKLHDITNKKDESHGKDKDYDEKYTYRLDSTSPKHALLTPTNMAFLSVADVDVLPNSQNKIEETNGFNLLTSKPSTTNNQIDDYVAKSESNAIKILNDNITNISGDKIYQSEENGVSMRKIKYARKMLRTAFIEFYRGLGLLRTFSSLNALAFAKILKKHDKVTGRLTSETYMKVVEQAHFTTSDKVVKMMEDVERLFTEHFAKDEKNAMMFLRPVQNEASHKITFFLGLFTGFSLALLMCFGILLHLYESWSSTKNQANYLQATYEVFGMLFLVLLHMYLYGWNVYAWRKARINYAFIFEFAPKTELRHREIFLVCTGLTTFILCGMVIHLMAFSLSQSQFNPDIVPLLTITGLLFLLICPIDIFYRSSRVYFLRCLKHVIFSPLYKVLLADFFLADQLTSQVAALRSLQFVMCYFFGGFFQHHDITTCASSEFRFLAYLISFLPYWWRLMQCLRRWVEEGEKSHLANGGKYLSAMVAAGARISYSYYTTPIWLAIFVITSSFATLYQMYWDIVRDWGFFQPKSQNPFLRDQLLLKNKSTYYCSIALNFVLRFAWIQQVTHWQIKHVEHNGIDLFFAALEVIRRGHWNFYRLENEHLNNVGKYRAVKLVPLPFRDNFLAHV